MTPQLVTNIVMDWATAVRFAHFPSFGRGRNIADQTVEAGDANDDTYRCSTIDAVRFAHFPSFG